MLVVRRSTPILNTAVMSLRRSARAKATSSAPNGGLNGAPEVVSKTASKGRTSKTAKIAKTAKAMVVADEDQIAMPPPSTPNRKRKHVDASTPAKPPPFTPTPSGVGLIADPVDPRESNGSEAHAGKKQRRGRPAEPHITNALLTTPKGSKIVANPLDSIANENATNTPAGSLTTDNLLEKANAHLIAVDPSLKSVIDQNYCKLFSPEGLEETIDPFRALVSGICGQQVSGAAAKSIRDKFVKLYNEDDAEPQIWPIPDKVAATDLARLRTAGLSQRKAEYIQGLAQKFVDGELSAKLLAEGSDEELLERLVAVRGLGRWSAEMFLTFALKRTDILSTGDLGVQRGMAAYMGRDIAKLKAKGGGKWKYMSEKDMLEISEKFSPYRSLFMWYMWRIENVDIDVMEKA